MGLAGAGKGRGLASGVAPWVRGVGGLGAGGSRGRGVTGGMEVGEGGPCGLCVVGLLWVGVAGGGGGRVWGAGVWRLHG